MMMQQMQQQMMMQQQIEAQQQIMQPQKNDKKFKFQYNVIFKTQTGKKDNLAVDFDITVEELLNKYINEYYEPVKGRLIFLYNAKQIKRNEQRTIKDFFEPNVNPKIEVFNF